MNFEQRKHLGGALALLLLVAGCSIERYPLPQVGKVGETGFGTGDSLYLMLNRQIELPVGADPRDIFISDDGHIYVAEAGTGRISVWDQALNEIGEPGLEGFSLPGVKGVAVGPEQLLFAVKGDNELWALNLQASREQLTWGLTRALARHRSTGEEDTLDAAEIADKVADRTLGRWEFLWVDSVRMESDEFQAQLRPRVIWSGSGSTRLDAVAKGRPGKREVFLANNNVSGGNEIRRLRLRPSAVLFTSNPDVAAIYLYDFESGVRVTDPGTGQGRADGLLSLDEDAFGSLYFTQAAPHIGYWKAQRMTVQEGGDGVDYWSFDTKLIRNDGRNSDLLEPANLRGREALDITCSASNIFMVDRDSVRLEGRTPRNQVSVFKLNGEFLLPLGARKVQVDSTLMVNDAPVDTLMKVWVYDQLADPRSVAVFGNRSKLVGNEDEIVFVADSSSIKLFMFSISKDDLPVQ